MPAVIGYQAPSLGAVKVTVNVPGKVYQRNTYNLCLLSSMERFLLWNRMTQINGLLLLDVFNGALSTGRNA